MIRRFAPWTFILLLLFSGFGFDCLADSGDANSEASESESGEFWKGKTLVIPVTDTDFGDSRLVRELDRMFRKANEDKPVAIIFEIQTSVVASWDVQGKWTLLSKPRHFTKSATLFWTVFYHDAPY